MKLSAGVKITEDTGLREIEGTLFTPPNWIPNLADAEDVVTATRPLQVEIFALKPNRRGLDRAQRMGVTFEGWMTMVFPAEEVVIKASDTPFGSASGVWTHDLSRAHLLARRLQAGTVWINTYRAMAFNSPFGGYKKSGIGRQNGMGAIDQYLQTKNVWCELSDEIQDPFVIKT